MRKLLLSAAVLIAGLLPANAQNVCPTAPPGTSNNQCASTAFVQTAIPLLGITVGSTAINNGTTGRVLFQNGSVLGEYTITGTAGSVVLSTSPTIASPTFSGTVAGANTIPLTILQQSAANTMLGNWSGSTANVSANAMPSCPDSGGGHLNYVSGTGITCGTGLGNAITALTGDVTATGPGSVAATLATAQPGAHTWALGQTFSSAITYGGVTLSNAVTGTGSMVLATSPSVSGLTVTGSFTATGLVGNAALVNSSITVNGTSCTLGSSCSPTATASAIVVGTTTITGGTSGRLLGVSAGPVLSEFTTSGSGTVVALTNTPILTTPNIGVATATSINGLTVTASTGVLTITNAKTAAFTSSNTWTGTDGATYTFPTATATIPRVVASGAKALATGAISSATCTSAQTDTATGTLTTDAISASFSADPTAVTGYIPSLNGMLTIIPYPTADTVNFKVCNNTAGSITPGAVTINWRVIR